MANKTEVIDKIDAAICEVEYIKSTIDGLKYVVTGEVDAQRILEYIEDAKDSIEKIRDSFVEYHEEVSEVEDDLEGLVKRLSEVAK